MDISENMSMIYPAKSNHEVNVIFLLVTISGFVGLEKDAAPPNSILVFRFPCDIGDFNEILFALGLALNLWK